MNLENHQEEICKEPESIIICKDLAVAEGYERANNSDYNFRKVLRDPDKDLYYSGWMDCFDWINEHKKPEFTYQDVISILHRYDDDCVEDSKPCDFIELVNKYKDEK